MTRRTVKLTVRCTPEEHTKIYRNAQRFNRPISQYLRLLGIHLQVEVNE